MFCHAYHLRLTFPSFVYNRLLGLTDGFYDEIKSLPLEEDASEQMDYIDTHRERKKSNKRKVF